MTSSTDFRPETYRLPGPGERDPYFGLCRSSYYELEQAKQIKLIRLRKPGLKRGITLIPFAGMRDLVSRRDENPQELSAEAH
jgi:hypothetical protein